MRSQVKYPIAQTAAFLWIGFVCAISFMEAWLKFSAPGITLPLGLGIGRLVFGALNIMEWFFAIVIGANLLLAKGKLITKKELLFFVPFILLLIQTIWLLPALDARAELYIRGSEVPESALHYYYVGFEIIKVVCLFIFGIGFYRKSPGKQYQNEEK